MDNPAIFTLVSDLFFESYTGDAVDVQHGRGHGFSSSSMHDFNDTT